MRVVTLILVGCRHRRARAKDARRGGLDDGPWDDSGCHATAEHRFRDLDVALGIGGGHDLYALGGAGAAPWASCLCCGPRLPSPTCTGQSAKMPGATALTIARPPDREWKRQGSAKLRQERVVDVACASPVVIHQVACEALQRLAHSRLWGSRCQSRREPSAARTWRATPCT